MIQKINISTNVTATFKKAMNGITVSCHLGPGLNAAIKSIYIFLLIYSVMYSLLQKILACS